MFSHKPVQPRRIATPRILQPSGTGSLWLLLVGLLGLVLWTWQMFEAGRGWAGYDFERSRSRETELQARIEQLESSVSQLRLEAASNARASQIDRDAVRQAQVTLTELQAERSRLTKEVNFLRGLLSAGRGPLHVRSFVLSEAGDNGFRYQLTVAQALRNIGATEGELRLSVSGRDAGGDRDRLGLDQLSKAGKRGVPLRFMHYQDLEGVIRLPQGFQPESVTIEIRPKNKSLKRVTEVFPWAPKTT